MSHPLGVRELKLNTGNRMSLKPASHPLGVRELKLRIECYININLIVAPFRGA